MNTLKIKSDTFWWLFMALIALRSKPYYIPAMHAIIDRHETVKWVIWAYVFALILNFTGLTRRVLQRGIYTKGLYRYYAHPAYLSYAFVDLVLMYNMTEITQVNIVTSIALNVCLLLTSYYEEEQLIEKFGSEATSYLHRTLSINRMLAFLKGKKNPQ